ncbi:heme peroxidase [Microdochium bolleyi]|uniref:Heme peroxidase n=1 Tax=Microdochium bolleyi TaxID=196109 RepID=A0A136J722_9PEZI|nr:heme peroxidase [Microdochium bolleyi]
MRWDTCLLSAMASLAAVAGADPTWPASTDELEEIMFQVTGYRARQFGGTVIPCANQALGPGRHGPAEWIRSAFHDVATTRFSSSGSRLGGMDGSLQFELSSGENVGQAFRATLDFMKDYHTRKTSIADLLSLGVYYASRACAGPAVPIRAGRIDATAGLGTGFIPIPQDQPQGLTNKFSRMGFSLSEGIELTACGHTLGSVHAANFPNLVAADDPVLVGGAVGLDSTPTKFDNTIAVEYIAWNSTNPLIRGTTSQARRTNSDTKLYSYEGQNQTIGAMARDNPTDFNARCSRVFQKMIEVVPPGVALSDPITPYFVKPVNVQLTLNGGASSFQLNGFIRIRTTGLAADPVTGVSITYKDRNDGSECGALGCTFALSRQGITNGFDDTFAWYPINRQIPTAGGISSFTVKVTRQSGQTQTVDNNGQGYPLQDKAVLMQPQSCFLSSQGQSGQLTVNAAIRNDRATMPVSAFVSYLQETGDDNLPIPQLRNATITLTQGRCAGLYTVYTGSVTIPGSYGYAAKLDVMSGSGSDVANDDFNSVTLLGANCDDFTYPRAESCSSELPSGGSSSSSVASSTSSTVSSSVVSSTTSSAGSTSSSVESSITSSAASSTSSTSASSSASSTVSSTASSVASSTSSSTGSTTSHTGSSTTSSASGTSSSAAVASPYHREVMGGYKLKGCQTEGDGVRALSAKSFAYDGMTLESCMKNCTGYNYWGTEYGSECYCANEIADSSKEAAIGDCNMICSGDKSQYCGAGNRLELYTTTSAATPTATLVHKPTVSPYTRLGCYSELLNARALDNGASSSDEMTNELCATRCKNYAYFATQYSRECYCGSELSADSKKVADSQCNMPCSGDQYTYCGGPSRLELYHADNFRGPSMPANITNVKGDITWTLKGCQTEGYNIRALTGRTYTSADNATLDNCAEFCSGFAFFGTEYSSECYCGNALNNGSVPAPTAQCNMLCSGNDRQYCGAGNRLSLYEKDK